LAVVRKEGRIVAFANLWPAGEKEELSIDLMRYDPSAAPHSVMDYLFASLMVWGAGEGYRWFNLGMAPPADLALPAILKDLVALVSQGSDLKRASTFEHHDMGPHDNPQDPE
jgi:lysylphosphatidylglycerol synthetase-like protein (DUF2156 family)